MTKFQKFNFINNLLMEHQENRGNRLLNELKYEGLSG